MKNYKRIIIDNINDTIDIVFDTIHCFMPFNKFIEETNCPFDDENIFHVSYEPDRNIFFVERRGGIAENGIELPEIIWIETNLNAIKNFAEKYKPEEYVANVIDQVSSILSGTDWLVIRHKEELELNIETSLSDEKYKQLLNYRQELRDISNSNVNLNDVVWPDDSFL